MNCVAFERWLDEGDVAQLPAEFAAHVVACDRCARALNHARALEAALDTHFSAEPVAAPASFAHGVLARIDAIEVRRTPALFASDALPWWVRVASEPTVVGASLLVAVLLWQGEAIMALTRAVLTSAAHPAAPAVVPSVQPLVSGLGSLWTAFKPVPGADWSVAIGLALGLAPLFALAGWALWRAAERLTGGVRTAS